MYKSKGCKQLSWMDKETGNLKQPPDQHKSQTQVPSQVAGIPLQVEMRPNKRKACHDKQCYHNGIINIINKRKNEKVD